MNDTIRIDISEFGEVFFVPRNHWGKAVVTKMFLYYLGRWMVENCFSMNLDVIRTRLDEITFVHEMFHPWQIEDENDDSWEIHDLLNQLADSRISVDDTVWSEQLLRMDEKIKVKEQTC